MKSLNRTFRKLNTKCGKNSIIKRIGTTYKKHDVFFVGRFQRLAESLARIEGTGDALQSHSESRVYCLRMVAQGKQRSLSGVGQSSVIIDNDTNTNGGHKVPVFIDGIKNKVALAVDIVSDPVALNHAWSPVGAVMVCEGEKTALHVAESMFA